MLVCSGLAILRQCFTLNHSKWLAYGSFRLCSKLLPTAFWPLSQSSAASRRQSGRVRHYQKMSTGTVG